ncbi:MAG: single-stranded DNA-binding protein [Actinomycetota bacterium]|nr:single-stranded DNA-binding protein [Actinomycetota bacterium]
MSLAVIDTNDVHLIGRLAKAPVHKTLPSGDAAVDFLLAVRRPPAVVRRQSTDSLQCTSLRPTVIKAAAGWNPGDVLEVQGALHRRFWRAGSGTSSVYEVEVRTVRRVSRAQAAKPSRRSVTSGAA